MKTVKAPKTIYWNCLKIKYLEYSKGYLVTQISGEELTEHVHSLRGHA